jgi:3-methyl-2-oxobutanoate hydroxymethyltransferase
VLVVHDILGLCSKYSPKFVKRYAELAPIISEAFANYIADVKSGAFPEERHCFK